jgi:hypothetical protein
MFDSAYHIFAIEAYDPLSFIDARRKTTAA